MLKKIILIIISLFLIACSSIEEIPKKDLVSSKNETIKLAITTPEREVILLGENYDYQFTGEEARKILTLIDFGKIDNLASQVQKKIEVNNLKIKLQSSVYETPAWGGVADQDFLNICIEVETSLGAYELLDTIQKIELELGRVRKEHWGNRTIDIDIITFNNLIFNDDRLVVPHKYIHERNFVLAPLTEMYGNIEIAGKNIKESLEKILEPISVYKEKL